VQAHCGDADRGLVGGAGGTGGVLQGQQRVNGLPCPDHVGREAGPGDRDELAQQMSTAQSMPGHLVAGVIRRPRVMAGDPGEAGEHPGGVHRLGAAPGMHGDQHVLA
jgi:hypothetical protein